jgi:hypothetical protein
MLYSEIIAVCSQIRKKHINTLCGQNTIILEESVSCVITWIRFELTNLTHNNRKSYAFRLQGTIIRDLFHQYMRITP